MARAVQQNVPIDDAFLRAAEPLWPGLRLHCYRMLGSSSDSDDVMQEVMLRAWRSRDTLADPAMLRPWLYRIATNACLDELARRPRRALASDLYPPADPHAELGPMIGEPIWIEPVPNAWIHAAESDPSAALSQKESVGLAFVAALHALTAMQRATLLLRDVVGFSADETAAALGVSVPAANSALFRAREAVGHTLGEAPRAAEDLDETMLARYVRAWESSDVDVLVALLRDDVRTTMPPRPTWIDGLPANAAFYRHMFETRGMVTPLRIVRTGANGRPALAYYRAAQSGSPYVLRALQVVEQQGGAIARIDHFMTPAVFPIFGLPAKLET